MSNTSISQIAYILALIGGILLVIFGLLDLIGFTGLAVFHFSFYAFAYAGIVSLICGIIAIIGARSASTLVWAIVLIIVGIIGTGTRRTTSCLSRNTRTYCCTYQKSVGKHNLSRIDPPKSIISIYFKLNLIDGF